MTRATILAATLVLVCIWVVLTAGITAVWLTREVRAVGLVLLPSAVVASLLVVYFDWRTNLRHRMLAQGEDDHMAT